MKAKLLRLNRTQIEQMYYEFFEYCTGCIDFITFVPKRYLVDKILKFIPEEKIKTFIEIYNY